MKESKAKELPFFITRGLVSLGALLFASLVLFLPYEPWDSYCQADYRGSQSPKTILDLQLFLQTSSIKIKDAQGVEGLATLMNLNPNFNTWYLLRVGWREGTQTEDYHLENTNPQTQRLSLESENPYGLIIADGESRYICNLWGSQSQGGLMKARVTDAGYAPICGGKLYLRNPAKGHRTKIEKVTDFLRDEVPAGEKIITFVRDRFFIDAYREKAKTVEDSKYSAEGLSKDETRNAPASALLDPQKSNRIILPTHLGIKIQESRLTGMVLGTWYAVKDNPGIYVCLLVPDGIAPEILRSYRSVVSSLDKAEADALVYLVAFDLDQFDLKFALGTEHPRVDWSDHIIDRMKDNSLPGPDGIGKIAPLVSTGLINPRDAGKTVAAFTGGFKRTHGAFKWGELSLKNHGSHYGFIENGVVFSRLQPGLSTIYVLNDGPLDMKTWTEEDNRLLPRIKYARQNGVPIIIEFTSVTQMSVPGPLVSRWREGNWAGSEDMKLRTMRAGAALLEVKGKRFLIYAVFTSATPSAMARVFQAFRCRYAMLLDMNALEHTYMAIYKRQGLNLYVQHLIQGMSEVDKSLKGEYIPRFLGYPDNRDFFFLLQKEGL
jgi:hypothetical protein